MLDQRMVRTMKCDINPPRAGVFFMTERCQNPEEAKYKQQTSAGFECGTSWCPLLPCISALRIPVQLS